jgi:SRSO17 transposase
MTYTIETSPTLNLSANELEEQITTQLKAYYDIYQPLFNRREQQEQGEKYFAGLLSDAKNKSAERMILERDGDDQNAVRQQQRFISNGAWSDEIILKQHWREVNVDLGDEEGVITLDGSDFPKSGYDSVGVKRQWCGQLGKTANCQAGVFLGYATNQGYALLNRRLYMPKEWLEDAEYAKRRKKCGVPADLAFKTKPALGLEMLKEVHQSQALHFNWLTCDEAFGRDTAFLDEAGKIVNYFAEIPLDTRAWLIQPKTEIPAWSGKGRKPSRERLVAGELPAREVQKIAADLQDSDWSTHTVKEGTKGPIVADFAVLDVITVRDRLPGPAVKLVFRRNAATGELKAFLSNAPDDTPLATFVWLSGMRWPIETCFEESKQEVGLGDYQVRSWKGWHHHMTMCILAHFFLVRLKLQLKDDAPALTIPQTVMLLASVLPQPEFQTQHVLEILRYYHRRHHAAYLSHRKRRVPRLAEVSL